jgi:hypothetical protein
MLLKCAQITIELHITCILHLLLQHLVSQQFLPGKLTLFGRVLKSVAYVALVRKAADEISITIFFQILRSKENK